MSRLNLFFINGSQFGYSAGHYFYCKYLKDSFNIKYICFDRGLEKMHLEDIEVIYISYSGNRLTRLSRFIKESIKNCNGGEVDILFVTYFKSCFILPIFCRFKRSILDIRTGSLKSKKLFRGIENTLIKLHSLFYLKTIILSESLQIRLNISRRSHIIPLGGEILFSGDKSFESFHLLYVGSFEDRNLECTIYGLKLFLQTEVGKKIEVKYSIIGFGTKSEINKIKDTINETGLNNIVYYKGRKNYLQLAPYFEMANLGVVFIPQTSGFDCQPSTKIFEYLLSGMPVIATITYENSIRVNDSNGVLIDDNAIDFSNGLLKLWDRRKLYNSAIIRGQMDEFCWSNIVSNNLKPFLLAVNSNKPRD